MSESEEKSNTKFYVIAAAALLFTGFATWAYRTYQRPVHITPKDGRFLADKFADSKLDSATVAPLPDAPPTDNEGQKQKGASGPAASRLSPLPGPAPYRQSTNAWLTGRVTLKGTPPVARPLDLDPECRADVERHKLPVPMTRDFEVGTNGGLANVIVTVMNLPGNVSGELPEPTTIEIRGCQIQPPLTGVMANQVILLKNHDTDFHELRGMPTNVPNPIIDIALLPGAPPPGVTFVNEEPLIKISTDKRPWIKGYISVAQHSYFGVTDSNGWFRIPRPPVGEVQLRALHPLLPSVTETFALDGTTNAPIRLVLEYQPSKETAP